MKQELVILLLDILNQMWENGRVFITRPFEISVKYKQKNFENVPIFSSNKEYYNF